MQLSWPCPRYLFRNLLIEPPPSLPSPLKSDQFFFVQIVAQYFSPVLVNDLQCSEMDFASNLTILLFLVLRYS